MRRAQRRWRQNRYVTVTAGGAGRGRAVRVPCCEVVCEACESLAKASESRCPSLRFAVRGAPLAWCGRACQIRTRPRGQGARCFACPRGLAALRPCALAPLLLSAQRSRQRFWRGRCLSWHAHRVLSLRHGPDVVWTSGPPRLVTSDPPLQRRMTPQAEIPLGRILDQRAQYARGTTASASAASASASAL